MFFQSRRFARMPEWKAQWKYVRSIVIRPRYIPWLAAAALLNVAVWTTLVQGVRAANFRYAHPYAAMTLYSMDFFVLGLVYFTARGFGNLRRNDVFRNLHMAGVPMQFSLAAIFDLLFGAIMIDAIAESLIRVFVDPAPAPSLLASFLSNLIFALGIAYATAALIIVLNQLLPAVSFLSAAAHFLIISAIYYVMILGLKRAYDRLVELYRMRSTPFSMLIEYFTDWGTRTFSPYYAMDVFAQLTIGVLGSVVLVAGGRILESWSLRRAALPPA